MDVAGAAPFKVGRPRQQQRGRALQQPTRALLSFFSPGGATVKTSGKAQQLVSELIELTEPTEGGLKARQGLQEEVEELVREGGRGCRGAYVLLLPATATAGSPSDPSHLTQASLCSHNPLLVLT